jgi:hypothetical protein
LILLISKTKKKKKKTMLTLSIEILDNEALKTLNELKSKKFIRFNFNENNEPYSPENIRKLKGSMLPTSIKRDDKSTNE